MSESCYLCVGRPSFEGEKLCKKCQVWIDTTIASMPPKLRKKFAETKVNPDYYGEVKIPISACKVAPYIVRTKSGEETVDEE